MLFKGPLIGFCVFEITSFKQGNNKRVCVLEHVSKHISVARYTLKYDLQAVNSITSNGVLTDSITEGSGKPFCPVANLKGGGSVPREV